MAILGTAKPLRVFYTRCSFVEPNLIQTPHLPAEGDAEGGGAWATAKPLRVFYTRCSFVEPNLIQTPHLPVEGDPEDGGAWATAKPSASVLHTLQLRRVSAPPAATAGGGAL